MQNGTVRVAAGVVIAFAGAVAATALSQDLGNEARRSSLVQRERSPGVPPLERDIGAEAVRASAAVYPLEFRTIDGVGNNLGNTHWGAADIPFLRITPHAYADGVAAPARSDGPSPREISNALSWQVGAVYNTKRATDYLWQWGQFLDHDIDETPVASPAEPFDAPVPAGDPFFDPGGTGAATIPLDRSAWTMIDGVREQVNLITAFIDASNVYGAEESRTLELRTLDGTGRLKTSPGDLLPFNTAGLPNAPTGEDPGFFLAGDVRANEQVGLTAMHTLFVREHNHWASEIRAADTALSGDEIFERARAIVGAEMQAITYNEFLPLLLGPAAIPPYPGYIASVNPGIGKGFPTRWR